MPPESAGRAPAYRIKNWDQDFENNKTRILKHMHWVPMPNKHDGDGYTELVMGHENGAAHFGAWCAIVQVASKCQMRGTLMRDDCRPHDSASLSRKTRFPEAVIAEAIPRLISIGWLETWHLSAGQVPESGTTVADEQNRTEQNRTEELTPPTPSLNPKPTQPIKRPERRGDLMGSYSQRKKAPITKPHDAWLPGELEYLIRLMPKDWQPEFSANPKDGVKNIRYRRIESVDPTKAYQHVLDVMRADKKPRDTDQAMAFLIAKLRDQKIPSDKWLEDAKRLRGKYARRVQKAQYHVEPELVSTGKE